jgi:NMD protein affecting ribosome stability and mRNA decay
MPKAFCFICGRSATKFFAGYCAECLKERKQLFEPPKRVIITICKMCKRVKFGKGWQEFDAAKHIRMHSKIHGEITEFIVKETDDNLDVSVTGRLPEGLSKAEHYVVELKKNYVTCSDDVRATGGYYEAVLQLRGNVTEHILKIVDKEIRNAGSFYTTEVLREGINLKIGSKAAIEVAAAKMKRMGATLTRSFRLVAEKGGKRITRTVIAARFEHTKR